MPKKQHKKESKAHFIYRMFWIVTGAALAAVSIELFLIPNNIIDGGIIGISLILDHVFAKDYPFINFGTMVILLNLPFMYSGYKQIGRTFMISSVFAVVCLAVIERLLHYVHPFTDQAVLATVLEA